MAQGNPSKESETNSTAGSENSSSYDYELIVDSNCSYVIHLRVLLCILLFGSVHMEVAFPPSGKIREGQGEIHFLESQGICPVFEELGKIRELFLSLMNGQGKSGNFALFQVN